MASDGTAVTEAGGWPRAFGRYVLLAPIAQGGMGDVCLALGGTLAQARRLCVMKTVRADLAGTEEFLARFLDEGRVLCALSHPNIGQVLEVGVEQGTPFAAMEYIAGVDLDALLDAARAARREVPLDLTFTAIASLLDAMDYAHRATALDGSHLSLVHRDISPQNVRLSWEGDVKVLDFGTAMAEGRGSHTAHGLVFGKPAYMSPEQARGEKVDPRSDLFAIGVVAWELISGADFAEKDLPAHMEALARHRYKFAPPSKLRPELPASVDGWFARLTAPDRSKRYPDAGTARRSLADIAQGMGLRLDRDAVARGIAKIFPGERERETERVRQWVSAAQSVPLPADATGAPPRGAAPLRNANTEPLGNPDASLLRGTRYRMGAKLGAGGMGEVFAAEHIDLGRPVALKVLYPDRSNEPGVAQRFRLEARAIAALSHPNLVHIYDLGATDDGRLFYAMERLLGVTLRERLDALGRAGPRRMSADECVRVGRAVALGLGAAHSIGVVHRDIKPENIFLCDDGAVKLLDFGVAKATDAKLLEGDSHVTRAGEIFGTPAYMAPEQGRGGDVDARTDLYALGAVLYECATGHEIFEGSTMVETLVRHMVDPPVPLRARCPDANIPPGLEAVILQCLSKKPDDRPPSAQGLSELLATCVDDGFAISATRPAAPAIEALVVPPPSRPKSDAPPRARRLALVFLGIAGGVLLATGVLLLLRGDTGNPPAASVAPAADAGAPRPAVPSVPAVTVAPVEVDAGAPRVIALAADASITAPDAGVAQRPPDVRALAAGPDTAAAARPAAHDHYAEGRDALEHGRNDDAIRSLTRAVERGQGGTDARAELGRAYLRGGRRDDALRQWRMVLERDPQHPRALRYLRSAGEQP